MAQKHLHELLKEDQEPFHLNTYIAEKHFQFKRPNPRTTLEPNKQKSLIIESSSRGLSLCKQSCFFSFPQSPDLVRKSPLADFISQTPKSPCNKTIPNARTLSLHIPARTAALLIEAAMRIQNQSATCSRESKPKSQLRNLRSGLFGSLLSRLKDRNRIKKREISANEGNYTKKVTSVDSQSYNHEMGFSSRSCSCNNSRLSSAGWSESNEDKSLYLDNASSCGRSEEFEDIGFLSCEDHFCSSPLNPTPFLLQKNTSLLRCTPELSSPSTSEDTVNFEVEGLHKIQLPKEEEEKEQCSPVSVLEPPFQHYDIDEEDDYDLQDSYSIAQRARQGLYRLQRFKKVAELDPVELQKRMLEEQDNESQGAYQRKDEKEVILQSRLGRLSEVQPELNRLVSDLIAVEIRSEMNGSETVAKRVYERLDSWGEVKSNTIDMMVELDFRNEFYKWKKWQRQVADMAMEIEASVFELLVEELSEELV